VLRCLNQSCIELVMNNLSRDGHRRGPLHLEKRATLIDVKRVARTAATALGGADLLCCTSDHKYL
jgi:hypothetical protein